MELETKVEEVTQEALLEEAKCAANPEAYAKELTDDLLKEADKTPSPQDIAAGMFDYYYPQFTYVLDQQTSASLKRVVKGLMAFKQEMEPEYKTEAEKDLTNLGRALLDARQTIILQYQIMEMKKAHDAATEAAQNISTSFSTEETTKEI